MAYRAPRYCYDHAARVVGASAITVSDAAHADFPEYHMVDDRNIGTLFKWSGSVVNPTIDVDLGASFATGFDRLLVPAGHNINVPVRVQEDDNSGFSTPTTLLAWTAAQTPGTIIDEVMTASSERYLRFAISGTGQFQLPQLIFTIIKTLTVGPDLDRSLDTQKANVTRIEQPTGLLPTVRNGPHQRVLEYDYKWPLSGADLTMMEAFIAAVGMDKTFHVDPHSFSATPGTDDPPIAMKFQGMPESLLTGDVPKNGVREKVFQLRLIESLD